MSFLAPECCLQMMDSGRRSHFPHLDTSSSCELLGESISTCLQDSVSSFPGSVGLESRIPRQDPESGCFWRMSDSETLRWWVSSNRRKTLEQCTYLRKNVDFRVSYVMQRNGNGWGMQIALRSTFQVPGLGFEIPSSNSQLPLPLGRFTKSSNEYWLISSSNIPCNEYFSLIS